jgi:hypothetical protein
MPIGKGHIRVPYEQSVKVVTKNIRLPGPAAATARGNGPPPKRTDLRRGR